MLSLFCIWLHWINKLTITIYGWFIVTRDWQYLIYFIISSLIHLRLKKHFNLVDLMHMCQIFSIFKKAIILLKKWLNYLFTAAAICSLA